MLADNNLHSAVGFVDLKSFQLCGGQSVRDERPNVGVPANNVNFFVVELANDVLDPLPAQPHTGAYGIDLLVPRPNGQLGPETRFAGDPFDLDRAVIDFGHFKLKQFYNKARIRARKNDFGTVRPLLDSLDVATDALANLVFLGRHALAVREEGLIFAEIDQDIRAIEPPDGATDNVRDAVFEFAENERFFGPANMLHEGLLGVLGRDPPETDRGDFHFDLLADLGISLDAPGVEHRDLVVSRNYTFRNDEFGKSLDITILLVDGYSQFTSRPHRFLGG